MPKEVDPDMAEAGSRFESEVRTAMRERGITTLAELERKTGIKRRSWEDWFAGIHAPRTGSLSRAEVTLRRSPDQLLSVWEGNGHPRRRPAPSDPALEAAQMVARAIDAQTEMLRGVLDRLAPLPVRPEQESMDVPAEQTQQIADAEETAQSQKPLPRSGRRDGAE